MHMTYALLWAGLAVAFWVRVRSGPEMGEFTLQMVLGCLSIAFPFVLWLVDSRNLKTKTYNCPVCRESLLGKVTPISIVTGRCWNCASRIFGDEE